MRKTIAEHMLDVLHETDNPGVMWGDVWLLDDCAERSTHTTLMDAHPRDRHIRVLNALETSPLFEKSYIRVDLWWGTNKYGHSQEKLVRCFTLQGQSAIGGAGLASDG